ncbi:MAG TPA: DUF3574 domain-containing protein [Rhodopila sp.]|jgi:hypothetical protein|nr:DUF3574 domain-containing protein [Rhodopila sp.]
MPRWILAACLVTGLADCTAPTALSCAPGAGAPVAIYTLYFGRSIPGREDLTDPEWRDFLNATVTPNLPHGYTVFDANGAWMNPVTHRTVNEGTKVLVAALPEGPPGQAAIQQVRAAYQLKFHQQLVGMTIAHGCGDF